MRIILILIVVLFTGIAQAQWTPAQQEQLARAWGSGQYQSQTQPIQYQQPNEVRREVRCFTRQVPGTGLFGNAPQFETVCK